MELDYESFHCDEPNLEMLYYSESWALANFLVTTRSGQRSLSPILKMLKSGKKRGPKDIASLKNAWYKDIEQRVLPVTK